MYAWSRDWTTILPLRKTLSAFHFNSVDFWSSISCIVLDFELADKNVIKELGVFLMGMFRDTLFILQKRYKPTKQAFWCTRNLPGIVWNSGSLDNNELQNVLPKDVKAEYFAKGTETCKFLSSLWDNEVENLDDHGCPKLQQLVESDKQILICSSYPFRHKTTLHCAERKANLFGEKTMQYLKL